MAAAGALQPYRILDLTTQRAWLAGKMLADLGATVVKVEPPGGDPGRKAGPFAGDVPDPEGALGWWAYNRGKQSATVDLERPKGRELFLNIAAGADAVLESFEPGKMEALGLGLSDLLAVNPRLVLTRVTPFGQTGPYARFAANDLILSAIGGAAWLAGDEDRPPVRVTAPQYFHHASAEAALHTTVALFHAAETGEGQEIDVSAQAATVRTLMNGFMHAYTDGQLMRREALGKPNQYTPFRSMFRCADGCVIAMLRMGPGLAGYRTWAAEAGEPIPDFLAGISQEALTSRDGGVSASSELVEKITGWLDGFFARRTRAALVAEGMRRKLLISGVNTLADILADEQLAARAYYQPVHPAGRNEPVRHSSVWAHLSATPLVETPAAPSIGQHNDAVWKGQAGLDDATFEALRRERCL